MERPKRKRLRLPEYDYSQNGCYFATICTKDRRRILWASAGQGRTPCLSLAGKVIGEELNEIPQRFPTVKIEKYVVMPDHIHALVILEGRQGQSPCPAPTWGAVISAYKSITTKRVDLLLGTPGQKLRQFRCYDHMIRNENDFLTKWTYIDTNPARWTNDCYFYGGSL